MAKIRPINEHLQKVAIEQLNEVPERIPADIEALRTWIQQQPHLKARTDDQFLVSFLRGCKYSLEKAKTKIDKFYTLRTKYPDLFCCHDVNDRMRELLKIGVLLYLPTPLHGDGPRIGLMRSGLFPVEKYKMEEIVRMSNAMAEIITIDDDYALINGVIFMGDLKKATAAHMFQMTPTIMKKMSVYSEQAMPLRPKQSHFFNAPSTFETVYNVLRPMTSKKQQERFFLHGSDLTRMYEHVPQKYLPKEYGGENGSIDEVIEYWVNKFDEYRDYFQENKQFGVDDNKRLGAPIDYDGLFGLDGSFRKLNVD